MRLVVEQGVWQRSTLNFMLTAKMGLITTPIKGTVEVTDKELTIDVDLGLLNRLDNENFNKEVMKHRSLTY